MICLLKMIIKRVVKRMLSQHTCILASRFESLPNLLHTSLPMVMFCPASTKYKKLHAIHKRESTPTGSASSRNFRFRLCSCKRLFSSCSVSPSVNNKPIIGIKQNGVLQMPKQYHKCAAMIRNDAKHVIIRELVSMTICFTKFKSFLFR